jgi:subtilase family serine protease
MLWPVCATIRRHVSPPLLTVLLCSLLCLLSTSVAFAKGNSQIGASSVVHGGRYATQWMQSTAPTDAQCRAILGVPCYSPQEMRNAYDLTPVLNAGFVGKGQTIVIIDSFGSPTAEEDLERFDADYGLPAPPSFRVISPLGTVPFDPTNKDQVGWAAETSLDVQWAHAMAPGANIVLLTSPVSETEGVQGMPEFLKLEEYALDHHLGQIISQSWGATENTLFTPAGREVFDDFEAFYKRAAFAGVTVLASAGDSGSANQDGNNNIYPFPTVIYPASSPWVTAVGGTSLHADTNGNYQSENVWNDGPGSATGGGISQTFAEPFYQRLLPRADQQLLNGHRGIPDIAYNGDPQTSVPVFIGFLPPGKQGYYLFGGTSEGSPQWAGLIADANQYVGHSLGFLNPYLYLLGANKITGSQVFHDIKVGNNAQPPVPGYDATPGWDAVSGWGTPIAQPLFQALARLE